MPIEPATHPTSQPGTVTKDRPCQNCGYNLRGLEAGGRCPECGTPISARRPHDRLTDGLVDAPMWYIKQIALAMGMMAAVVIGVILTWLAFWLSLLPGIVMLAAMTLLAGLWFAASWLATTRRPIEDHTTPDPILDHDRLRTASRWSQVAGLLVFALIWTALITNLRLFGVLGGLASIGVLFGLVPLGVYLSALADWSGDTGVGGRLRAAVWCIAVCGSLLIFFSGLGMIGLSFGFLAPVLVPILSLIVMVGVGLFGWSVIQLSIGAAWAIQNSIEAEQRRLRLEEKRRRRAQQAAEQAERAAAAMAEADRRFEQEMDEQIPDAIPLSDEHTHHPPPKGSPSALDEKKIQPATDATPYELAPEDEQ